MIIRWTILLLIAIVGQAKGADEQVWPVPDWKLRNLNCRE